MVAVTSSLLVLLSLVVFFAVARLPRPRVGGETLHVLGDALEIVLASERRPRCSLLLLTDGTTSATTIFKKADWLQVDGGLASFELIPDAKSLNKTKTQLALMIASARMLRQVTRCMTVVVVSDNPAFLIALGDMSLKGRFLKWTNRLLAVTRQPLKNLLHLHPAFSMMNAMLVIMDVDSPYPSCKVYVHLPYSPSNDQIDWVASWSSKRGFLLGTQLQLFPEKFSRFVYRPTLTVAAEQFPPHVILNSNSKPGHPQSFVGPIANVLELLAQDCNFTYTYVRPPDGTWGTKKESGSWSGMVGMVHRKEAEIGLGPFGISATRAEVIDYVYAIISDSLKIMGTSGRPEVDPWGFLVPLGPLVFTVVLVVLIVILVIHSYMASYTGVLKRGRTIRAWEDFFLYVRVTLRQDMPLPILYSWERLILGGWMVMTIVLTRSYAGALMSMLAIKNIAQPFQSLRDVLRDQSITMIWQANTVHMQYMWTVKSGLFREVLDKESVGRLMYVTSPEYMFVVKHLLPADRHVLVVEELTSRDLMADYFSHKGECRFYLSKEGYLHIYFSMIGQKDHPLVPAFSRKTKLVTEAGLYEYWMRHVSANATRCRRTPTQITLRAALSFMNVWGMFVVFVGGHFIGLILLILELLLARLLQKRGSSIWGFQSNYLDAY